MQSSSLRRKRVRAAFQLDPDRLTLARQPVDVVP
jgi:hypothetical protein